MNRGSYYLFEKEKNENIFFHPQLDEVFFFPRQLDSVFFFSDEKIRVPAKMVLSTEFLIKKNF